MNNQTKQILFDNFLNEWETQFRKIPFILKYIDTYPELKVRFSKYLPFITDNLNDSQSEWVSLVAQLDNPVDNIFFKPYWVPIQMLDYDVFIDLSSESFPIFRLGYFFLEPYRWYKKYLFKSMVDLLVSVDDHSIDILNQIEKNTAEAKQIVDDYFLERDRLGFSGQLKAEPVEKYHLQIEIEEENLSDDTENNVEKEVKYEENSFEYIDNNTIVLKSVKPYSIGLMPYEGQITLCEYDGDEQKLIQYKNQVKCFNAFLYLLRSKKSVNSFKINLDKDSDTYAEYRNHQLKIYLTKIELLDAIKIKFDEILSDF